MLVSCLGLSTSNFTIRKINARQTLVNNLYLILSNGLKMGCAIKCPVGSVRCCNLVPCWQVHILCVYVIRLDTTFIQKSLEWLCSLRNIVRKRKEFRLEHCMEWLKAACCKKVNIIHFPSITMVSGSFLPCTMRSRMRCGCFWSNIAAQTEYIVSTFRWTILDRFFLPVESYIHFTV